MRRKRGGPLQRGLRNRHDPADRLEEGLAPVLREASRSPSCCQTRRRPPSLQRSARSAAARRSYTEAALVGDSDGYVATPRAQLSAGEHVAPPSSRQIAYLTKLSTNPRGQLSRTRVTKGKYGRTCIYKGSQLILGALEALQLTGLLRNPDGATDPLSMGCAATRLQGSTNTESHTQGSLLCVSPSSPGQRSRSLSDLQEPLRPTQLRRISTASSSARSTVRVDWLAA